MPETIAAAAPEAAVQGVFMVLLTRSSGTCAKYSQIGNTIKAPFAPLCAAML
jgi:hypothetical protein